MAGFGLYHLLILRLLINFNITDKTKLHNLIFLGITRLKAPTAQEVISFIRTKKGVRSLFVDEKIKELISFRYYKLASALKYQPLLRNCVEISLARYDNLESINEEVNSFLPVRKKNSGEKVSLVKIWGY